MPLFAAYYNEKDSQVVMLSLLVLKNSGVKRARSLAEYLDAPIAIIDYAQDDAEREEGYIIGEVEGKTAIIVDDILNTGKTFAEAAKILERAGVKDIYAVASHGLFGGGAAEILNVAPIKEILVRQTPLQLKKKFQQDVKYISASEANCQRYYSYL
ncbi:MAG: phosphoribosyltransferase family protein [Streptococcus sp.]